jgi:hypothetical protein
MSDPTDAPQQTKPAPLHALREVNRHRVKGRVRRLLPCGFALVAAAVLLAVAVTPGEDRATLLARLVPWVAMIALWWIFFRIFLVRMSARAFRRHPDSQHPLSAALTDDAYEVTEHSGTARHFWHALPQVVETPEVILFFINPNCAQYIPKRVLRSDAELRTLRELVRAKVGGRARLLDDAAAP